MKLRKKYCSNHLSSFVQLVMIKKNIEMSDLSEQLKVDSKEMADLFIRNKRSTNYSLLLQVIKAIGLNENKIFNRNLSFEKTRNSFFNSFFYCLDSRKIYYEEIMNYRKEIEETPYFVDLIVIDFIYTVILVKDRIKANYLSKYILTISTSLSNYYKKLCYVYYTELLKNSSMFEKGLDFLNYASTIYCNDKHLDGRLYYIGMSIYRGLGNLEKAKNNYFQAKQYLTETNNIAMLENLNLKYSGLLRISGEIQAALKNDLKLLEDYTVKQYRLRNIEILFNNIGWTYSLLHNYKKAVIYYQKALETLNDNDVYFNMAYCLYKIGEDNLSLTYIQRGRKAPVSNAFITPFFDWLELMIEKPYCSKSYELLKAISTDYSYCLEDINKTMIQIEIINYYYYNHMYEEAIHALQPLMGKQLISPSELIFTKKNENRNDLLFSEDELTLRSQMMESDDLFFEDDELGEDEWEELDDSFSRFMHN